jgi:hypothetical protein
MSQFTPTTIVISDDDKDIVSISKMLSLIKGSQYEAAIYESLSVEQHKGERIPIVGAATLVKHIEESKNKYVKFDVLADFANLTFTPNLNNSQQRNHSIFELSFDNDKIFSYPDEVDSETKAAIEQSDIKAEPAHEAQNQLFQMLFSFNKYANELLDASLVSIVDTNLKLLKSHFTGKNLLKRYRLLRQNDNGKYFFRAIISATGYQDYNIGVSVFIALVSMHQAMQKSQRSYKVKRFSYSESELKVYFENSVIHNVEGLGRIKFGVLLSNNEIASGAVKLSGFFSFMVKVDGKDVEIEAKQPEDEKKRYEDVILSISHGYGPETSIKKMAADNALRTVEDNLIQDLAKLSTARNHGAVKIAFLNRLKNSHKLAGDASKAELNKLYKEQVNSFNDLLVLLGRAQLIADSDGVDAKDYLKYVVHTTLAGPAPSGPSNQNS